MLLEKKIRKDHREKQETGDINEKQERKNENRTRDARRIERGTGQNCKTILRGSEIESRLEMIRERHTGGREYLC